MTSTLDKSKEVIKILLEIIHDKEDPIDEELQIKESNDCMDQNPTTIATEEKVNKSIEYSTSDARYCQVDNQFLESSTEGTEDSSIGLENDSQNDEVLVKATVDVSTDLQIVDSLEDQFFILLEHDPEKELDKKSGKETNLKPCIESPDSDLQDKEKSLVSKTVEKKFQCDICQKLFKKNHKLTEHKKFHSNEKKIQCPSCGKCFVQSRSL